MSCSAIADIIRFPVSAAVALFLLAACWLSQPVQAGEIVLIGVYQGKNLFVQNPFAPDKQDYCVDEVYVNDVKKMSNIKHSAFEIDLSHLEIDAEVTVKILHKDGCTPKIINPQVLRPSATFQFSNITVNDKSIDWTTTGETPKHMFYVEQFVNGSWLAIKKFEARNTGAGIYSLPVTHNFGLNKYRIKAQNEDDHHMFYSRVVEYDAKTEPVTFYPKSVTSKIILSRPVGYEIVDIKGNTLKKGKGTEIPLSELKSGVYYLNYDNRSEKFFKK